MAMKFPFVENTLGKKLEAGTGLTVDCLTCRRHAVLNIAEMVRRFGPEQPCLHWNLLKIATNAAASAETIGTCNLRTTLKRQSNGRAGRHVRERPGKPAPGKAAGPTGEALG